MVDKKRIVICIFSAVCLMVGITACSGKEGAQTDSPASSQNSDGDSVDQDAPGSPAAEDQNTVIEKENLADLIFRDGKAVPGESLEWYMTKDTFLDGMYGSEVLDPDSERFEEYRVSEMQNGMASYNPPVKVTLKTYDVETDPTFVFDSEGQLIKSMYRITYPASEAETYIALLDNLAGEADSMEELEAEQPDSRDLSEQNVLENPVTLKWNCKDGSCYFQVNSVQFQDTMILDLISSLNGC